MRGLQNCAPDLCRRIGIVLLLSSTLVVLGALGGCGGNKTSSANLSGGGYYGGDRPPDELAVDPDSVGDAVPRKLPLSETGNQPYTVYGKRYHPLPSAHGYVQRGIASWYGSKFQGRRTSSGERYDMFAMTAAHPILPLPSFVRVTNLDNRRSVVVKVNDRGPFLHNRIIDLSYIAAHKLGIAEHGTGRVEVRAIVAAANQNTIATAAEKTANNGAATIWIQVGAFAQRDNAESVRRVLQNAGFELPPLAADAQLYRVRVGPFTPAEVATARRELEALVGHAVVVANE